LKADEILIVDNASTDGTVEMLRDKYPLVNLISMPFNTGCPGGRNIGILNTLGEIIFFLDDDCIIDCDAIEKVVQRFNEEPELGVISMAVVNYDADSKLQPFFSPNNLGNEERYFYNFSGGASAIKRKVFNAAGLFPQEYMYGGEERDLSYRIMAEGFRILYFPRVRVHHKASSSMRDKYKRFKTSIFNELLIFMKYYPLKKAILTISWKLFYFLIYSLRTRSFLYYLLILMQVPWFILKKAGGEKYRLNENILRLEQFLKSRIVRNYEDVKSMLRGYK
jgi:GT2 family glycosyltransferase